MALEIHETRISREDYLEGEIISSVKHEYIAGQVYAMSGGSLNHQTFALNFLAITWQALKGKKCRPTGSDFKLNIPLGPEQEAFYYPDAAILCKPTPGDSQYTDSPTVILEVLSPSTRRIDEIQKYRDYITIPSLQTYILAETNSPTLTIYRREGENFRREILSGPDTILQLPEVEISIPFSELYQNIDFPTE